MPTKDFTICLDMKRTLPFYPFEVVEADTGNVLHVTLLNDGTPLTLSGCEVCMVFASPMGFAIQDLSSGLTLGNETGTFDALLYPSSYSAGNVSADIQVYSGQDRATLISSTRFDFRCRRALINGDIIRANTAYPPLVEATRQTQIATAAALAAAARIDTDIGELNVQADWSETDAASDAFIQNKPSLVPSALGAADRMHAACHASDGSDPVSAASIGAEPCRLAFADVAVSPADFVRDADSDDYPYRADLALAGVTADMTPEVVFSLPDAAGGNYAPVSCCRSGAVRIFASDPPEQTLTIPTVYCFRPSDATAAWNLRNA